MWTGKRVTRWCVGPAAIRSRQILCPPLHAAGGRRGGRPRSGTAAELSPCIRHALANQTPAATSEIVVSGMQHTDGEATGFNLGLGLPLETRTKADKNKSQAAPSFRFPNLS